MMSEKQFMRGAMVALAVCVGALGYNQTRARADGIPAMRPLTYAGTLEEGAAPVNGTRNLRLTVWDDATSTESARNRCITSAPGTTVTNGRFQVVLDAACAAAVRATPDLWLEIEVNGTSLGRTKLSAVPFAIEANRANELTPAASNALVPTGTVVAFAGTPARVPAGWLLCDGRSVTRAMYPALFDAIGTAHGGDGTNFNLPDLRGRTVVGAGQGTGLTMRTLGQNFGAETQTLTVAQMPAHSHNGQTGDVNQFAQSQDAHFDYSGTGAAVVGIQLLRTAGGSNPFNRHQHSVTTESVGGGMPHNIVQPSSALNFIIKL